MKIIHMEFSNECLITPSGLVFVGQILGKSNFIKKINRAPVLKNICKNRSKMMIFFLPTIVYRRKCGQSENLIK